MELKKIRVKCASAIEVVFRKQDVLYNNGIAVIDMDTYNFVGRLGNDFIYGKFHEIGFYEIMYIYVRPQLIKTENGYFLGSIESWKYEFDISFVRDYYMKDFEMKLFKIGEDLELSFEHIIMDGDIINSCLEENEELII